MRSSYTKYDDYRNKIPPKALDHGFARCLGVCGQGKVKGQALTAQFPGAFGAATGTVDEGTIDAVHPGEIVFPFPFDERGQVLALPKRRPDAPPQKKPPKINKTWVD